MKHVRNGCLSRPTSELRSDGSRIKGSHVAWNSIQRGNASGLEMMTALGHDHTLRWNVARNDKLSDGSTPDTTFSTSCFGSAHIAMVDVNARLWNDIITRPSILPPSEPLTPLPILADATTNEQFGLVLSKYAKSRTLVKNEDLDSNEMELFLAPDDVIRQSLIEELKLTELSFQLPQPRNNQAAGLKLGRSHSITPPSDFLGANPRSSVAAPDLLIDPFLMDMSVVPGTPTASTSASVSMPSDSTWIPFTSLKRPHDAVAAEDLQEVPMKRIHENDLPVLPAHVREIILLFK